MPTLQDVARRAGVSTATVSKVLSNTPYFTDATRDKVLKAVEELGYVPNLAARALSTGKTRIIAVVFPYIYDAIFTDPLTLRILEGIEIECRAHGYNILLSTPQLTPDGPDEHYMQLIRSRYLDGVIALDNVPITSVLEPVQQKGIPSVAIGYHQNSCFVHSDDLSGGRQLMEHVVGLGHQQIGIIAVAPGLNFSVDNRVDGLRQAAHDVGLDFEAMPRLDGDFSTDSGTECTYQLLSQYPQITALIVLNDRMAMGAIQQARVMGRVVPDTLTVVGYDDIPTAAIFAPSLTTINQQAPELGRAASQILFELLNGKQPESINLPVHLVVRGSSAPPA